MKSILENLPAKFKTYIVIMLPFVFAILALCPFGNVLYGGDDWAYAWSVKTLLESGKLIASDWSTAMAVPQILWGYLFSILFGFNLTILNISTIIFAIIGIIGLYYLIIEFNFSNRVAIALTWIISTTPLYIGLASTFMTDMFFNSLMIISCLFYVRTIRNEKISYAILGGVFASLAILERQVGITLIMSFSAVMLWLFIIGDTKRFRVMKIFMLGICIPTTIFLLMQILPDIFGGRTIAQTETIKFERFISNITNLKMVIIKLFFVWNYMVIILLPILIIMLLQVKNELLTILKQELKMTLFVFFILLFLTAYLHYRIGHLMIRGDAFQVLSYGEPAIVGSFVFWNILFGLGIIASSILSGLARFKLKSINRYEIDSKYIFIVICLLSQIILMSIYDAFFNNYFLPLIPLCSLIFIKLIPSSKLSKLTILIAITYSIFSSIIIIKEHISYAEANWKEADNLVENKIDSKDIFGWPSWYAWNNQNVVIGDIRKYSKEGKGISTFSVFNILQDKTCYLITSENPRNDFKYFKRKEYKSFFWRRSLFIYSHKDF